MNAGDSVAAVPRVRKIAVLRANAIGDLMVTLPAFDALRAAYLDAEIVLLGKTWHAEFLRGRPGPIDRVAIVPPWPGITAGEGEPILRAVRDAFINQMRTERFDLAVQIHGGGRNSNPLIRQLNAGMTIGTRTTDAELLDRSIPYDRWQHETLRSLEVVGLAGAANVGLEPHLQLRSTDREEAQRVLVEGSEPLVTLHPGASNPERWWPAERFAAVGNALASEGYGLVLVGTEEERMQVDGVLRHLHAPACNLCGRLSLGGLAGVLQRCRLMVGNDSGPLHLAAAVGTPTVGVYSFFNLLTYGPLSRARHLPAVSWGTATEGETRSLVTDVETEEVLAHARQLL